MVLPAVSFAAGIFISAGPLWAVLAAGALALVPGRARWPAALVFWFLLGGLVADRNRPGPAPELDAEPGEVLLVSGCVAGAVVSDGVQVRFPLELEPGARALVTLTAKPGESLPRVAYGQKVEATARVRKPRNFGNPGAFDYVGYLRRSAVYWLVSVRGAGELRVLPGECGSSMRRGTLGLRDWLVARIRRVSDEELMPALLVGDNFGLDRVQTAEFRRTGTYHAIVVSGLHISVVAGTALLLMRLLRVPLTVLVVAGTALAWAYAAVADWQAPVVRSAVGFTLFLAASWFYRRGRLLNLLAVTAMVLLAADPSSIYDASFQLTFLSVAAIAGLAMPVAERTYAPCRDGSGPRGEQFRCEMTLVAETFGLRPGWVIRGLVPVFWVLELMTVSACVQVALIVPSVAYFHQVSATSVLANVLVVPALSIAVPIGLLAAITGWHWLATVAGWLVGFGRGTAAWWSAIEPGFRIPDSPWWVGTGLLGCVVLAGAGLVWRRSWVLAPVAGAVGLGVALLTWQPVEVRGLWTGVGLLSVAIAVAARWRVVGAVALAVVAGVVMTWSPVVTRGEVEVSAIDVGQGDSLFVQLADGRRLLVDGGGIPMFDPRVRSRMDIGEDVVSPYLWRRGVRRLDYVAVTHLHDDHAGGLPAVIRNFRPREVWTGVAPPSSALLRRVREAAATVGARVITLREGDSRPGVQVLWPKADAVAGEVAKNDESLVLLLSNGRHRFLLMGDAEGPTESGMTVPDEIDVLKAGHHGSRTSTGQAFLDRALPLFAMISAGEGNTYGHPHGVVLERLKRTGTRVLRTDQKGLLSIKSDGFRLNVSAFRE